MSLESRVKKLEGQRLVQVSNESFSCQSHRLIHRLRLDGWFTLGERLASGEDLTEVEQEALDEAEASGLPLYPPEAKQIDFKELIKQKVREAIARRDSGTPAAPVEAATIADATILPLPNGLVELTPTEERDYGDY
jgi:hypothetical protein